MSDRFNVASFTAAGSVDFSFKRVMPNWYGLQVQFEADSTFSATILARNGLGTFADVTSLMCGSAAITVAGDYFQGHFIPETVRVNVTAVGSHVNFSVGA